jgi:hypothetical protein
VLNGKNAKQGKNKQSKINVFFHIDINKIVSELGSRPDTKKAVKSRVGFTAQ